MVPEDVGSQGPEEAFSRAGLDSVVRPPPTTAPAEQEEHRVSAGATEKNKRRVRFQPAVIIEVPSWKGETREMNYGGPDKLRGTWRKRETYTLAPNDPSNNGLSHHGDPEEEEEVVVLEEPQEEIQDGPKVVRVPRTPTQAEIDAHSATHLPHAEWCEFCMAGRGRNKPHMRKKEAPKEATEREPGCQVDESESDGSPGAPSDEDPSKAEDGPVPRVSMDYFYVSSQRGGPRKGANGMSTKEIKRKLAEIGRSIEGPRNVLVKRYEKFEP